MENVVDTVDWSIPRTSFYLDYSSESFVILVYLYCYLPTQRRCLTWEKNAMLLIVGL